MENKEDKNINSKKETDRKLDKMRLDLSDSEKCKDIARKLTEYIKNKD